jgi:hypothetical protein
MILTGGISHYVILGAWNTNEQGVARTKAPTKSVGALVRATKAYHCSKLSPIALP